MIPITCTHRDASCKLYLFLSIGFLWSVRPSSPSSLQSPASSVKFYRRRTRTAGDSTITSTEAPELEFMINKIGSKCWWNRLHKATQSRVLRKKDAWVASHDFSTVIDGWQLFITQDVCSLTGAAIMTFHCWCYKTVRTARVLLGTSAPWFLSEALLWHLTTS